MRHFIDYAVIAGLLVWAVGFVSQYYQTETVYTNCVPSQNIRCYQGIKLAKYVKAPKTANKRKQNAKH